MQSIALFGEMRSEMTSLEPALVETTHECEHCDKEDMECKACAKIPPRNTATAES